MTIKKRLMGCIEIDSLIYPENFSLQELLPLVDEAKQLTTKYAFELANLQLCIFHTDALIRYCMFPYSKKAELLNIKVGENAKVFTQTDCYMVYRLSEHFYKAKLMQVNLLYNEEPIAVKNAERQKVTTQVRQEVKQEKAKQERVRLHT